MELPTESNSAVPSDVEGMPKESIVTVRSPESARPRPRTLREIYCERNGVSDRRFVDHFLARVLHRSGRVVYALGRPFVRYIDRSDRELVVDLGNCTSRSEIRRTLSRLPNYYGHWNFWRSVGKIRVSAHRISAQVADCKIE